MQLQFLLTETRCVTDKKIRFYGKTRTVYAIVTGLDTGESHLELHPGKLPKIYLFLDAVNPSDMKFYSCYHREHI